MKSGQVGQRTDLIEPVAETDRSTLQLDSGRRHKQSAFPTLKIYFYSACQGLRYVGNEVVRMFYPDRKPDRSVEHSDAFAHVRRYA